MQLTLRQFGQFDYAECRVCLSPSTDSWKSATELPVAVESTTLELYARVAISGPQAGFALVRPCFLTA